MSNVNITSKGIQKILKKYNAEQAIAEYIWNGFDAKADTVFMNYRCDPLGTLEFLEISDNGYGINFDNLKAKFEPFYESEKAIEISAPVHTSAMHGKNGVGRLTFFTFAYSAEWTTTFQTQEGLKSGKIQMSAGRLNNYEPVALTVPMGVHTGTAVTFRDVQLSSNQVQEEILPYLTAEFCWFLELNRSKNFRIIVNGEVLDYEPNITYREELEIPDEKSGTLFRITFVQWNKTLHRELSKYYFLNSEHNEMYKDFTTLNKKADDFFHSVYIQSSFFDDFNFISSENDQQDQLFGKTKSSPEYKLLIKELNKYILGRRKPYLKTFGERMVDRFEQDGILPQYANEWEQKYKKPQLEQALISLYEAEPKLFTNLNTDQKKVFVRFLDLLMESSERDQIFTIMDGIIDLEQNEREELARLFRTTRLNRIVATIKLIEDRYQAYHQLKELVLQPIFKANEVEQLQKAMGRLYWILGEQYHLLSAMEPRFEEVLRKHSYLLTEQDSITETDQAGIWVCRQHVMGNRIDHVMVELKHPALALGKTQFLQVDQYLDMIIKQPEFNADNIYWEFYLIGHQFDPSGFIERQIATHQNQGAASLALSLNDGRVKVYVKTWTEIFADFEMKHRHLYEKLKQERDQLVSDRDAALSAISAKGEKAPLLEV